MILKDKQSRQEENEVSVKEKKPNQEVPNRLSNPKKKSKEVLLEAGPLKAGVFIFNQNKPNELEHFLNENNDVTNLTDSSPMRLLVETSRKEQENSKSDDFCDLTIPFRREASLSKEIALTNESEKSEKISFSTPVSDGYIQMDIQKTVEEKENNLKDDVAKTGTVQCDVEVSDVEVEIAHLNKPRTDCSSIHPCKTLVKEKRTKKQVVENVEKKSDFEQRARLLKEKKLKEEEARLLKEKKANEEVARILREKKRKEEEDRLLKEKKLKEIEARLLKDKKNEEEEKARLIREKKVYEEQKARIIKEKRLKEEEERLLKVKRAKEEEERLIREKRIREEQARLLKVKQLKEEEERLLAKKKSIEEEKLRLLKEKKQKEEEKTRSFKEKKDTSDKNRIHLREKFLEKYATPKVHISY